jgi:release factor glutamine methyltransferase
MAEAVALLAEAGCDTPRLDAELLLSDALGVDRSALYTRTLDPPEGFRDLIRRRAEREPVAYIVGRRAFRRIELRVDPRVLIPRPDTETLVEAALELPRGARVHDVGTGSGAVALALKDERPDLAVSGSDASADAVEVARANAERLRLDVSFSVARGLTPGAYDLVVGNLPYVREDEWDALPPEIRLYEPREALVSGADGLDAIRELVGMASGTPLALEHAPGQAAAVRALLRDARTLRDLAGRERVTVGRAP